MKYKERIIAFQKAVSKLDEILKIKCNDITRDSAIKRFEFSFELSWKVLQDFFREKGILCGSPRDCFSQAFSYGIIKDNPLWIKMIEDRNLTVHTYEEELAEGIYHNLKDYLSLFKELLENLRKEIL